MLYSAEENLAIAVSESPTGPFVKLTDGWLRNRTIDGHLLFDDDGSIYIYFADPKNSNRIFTGKMSADIVGTGHHSFMPTADKDKYICAFHYHSGNPDNGKPRMVCLSAADFEKQQGKQDRLCILTDEKLR